MAQIQIIVGSMLGGSEYVAEACQEVFTELNYQSTLHFSPVFNEIPQKDQIWLICTSTHGAGDYPDNIESFINDLTLSSPPLDLKGFLVIGLGDSNYDTFCYAAKKIENLLLSKGCKQITPTLTLDNSKEIDPEEESMIWIRDHKDHLS